jgi:hypothetical protein
MWGRCTRLLQSSTLRVIPGGAKRREGNPAVTLMQPARQGTRGAPHSWIPFPTLRVGG